MRITKNRLKKKFKSSLGWAFLLAVYPYLVLSFVYTKGVSVTSIIFSYVSLIPTMILINFLREAKEKSMIFGEFIAEKMRERYSYNDYNRAVKIIKVLRITSLVVMCLIALKILFTCIGLVTFVSSSISMFTILLLQIYYIAVLMIRVKYEA